MEIIISAFVGLITGAVGSLIAPWVNWRLELKKENRKDKIKLISDLRAYLEQNEPKEMEFLNSPNYIRIRPFLSDTLIYEMEDFETVYLEFQSVRSSFKARLLQELDDIEESWDIAFASRNKKKISYQMAKRNLG